MVEVDEAVFLHAVELAGEGAAVHAQVVGELLARVGDGEDALLVAVAGLLGGEVAHETAADRARRDVGNLAGKGQVALGEGAEEVAHEARVIRAGRGAGAQDALEVDEGHRGVDDRDDVDVDRHAGCGKGLGEHVARTRAAQD